MEFFWVCAGILVLVIAAILGVELIDNIRKTFR